MPDSTTTTDSPSDPRATLQGAVIDLTGAAPANAGELVTALRALPFGGVDDAARHLAIAPHVQATVSPIVAAIRWAALTYGMIFGTFQAFQGSYAIVVTVSVCLFLTVWRSMLPIRLGSGRTADRVVSVTDTLLIAAALGYTGGARSPFVFCLLAAVLVAGFGWGLLHGAMALVAGWGTMLISQLVFHPDAEIHLDQPFAALLSTMLVAVAIASYARHELVEGEARRRVLQGRVESLSEVNDLLTLLNAVAKTLPTSLNQRDALDAATHQVVETFGATVVCLLEQDDKDGEWTPKVTEGCAVKPTTATDDLPAHLRQAIDSSEPWLVADLTTGSVSGLSPVSGSGLYTQLVSRGRPVGVLGIEHPEPGRYQDRDRRLLAGMADVVALTLDNARWFGRLRSLGAEGERARIARDLHDRLGQWLTYISFELEQFIQEEGSEFQQLQRLYHDVQTALDELRETLRQLRSGITDEMPLAVVGRELADRFAERTGKHVRFVSTVPGARLPIPVETEVLRILQEALNNVEKHADATEVEIHWRVVDGAGELRVRDDGRGFDTASVTGPGSYGLVGMRERVDVIGGHLTIESRTGQGTTVVVTVGAQAPEGEVTDEDPDR